MDLLSRVDVLRFAIRDLAEVDVPRYIVEILHAHV